MVDWKVFLKKLNFKTLERGIAFLTKLYLVSLPLFKKVQLLISKEFFLKKYLNINPKIFIIVTSLAFFLKDLIKEPWFTQKINRHQNFQKKD